MQPFAYMENDHVIQAPSEFQKPYDHGVFGIKAPNWDIKTVDQVLTKKAVDVINDHFKNYKKDPLFLYFRQAQYTGLVCQHSQKVKVRPV